MAPGLRLALFGRAYLPIVTVHRLGPEAHPLSVAGICLRARIAVVACDSDLR